MDQDDGYNGKSGQRAAKRQRTDAESTSLSPTRGNPVADTAKPVTNLAPNGDIVLALSDHSRLRVHSVVLKLASPVFKAMFGPHFSEGQNLSEANPKEVPLPDDPPEAMTIICEILHYHNRYEPAPGGELLRAIVTLVDKYDLIAATGLKIKSFLEERFEAAKCSQFRNEFDEELLAMSYMLKDEKAFKRISRELIVFYDKSFGTLNDPFNILPSHVLLALEEERTAIRKSLNSIITETLVSWFQNFDSMSHSCERSHSGCARNLLFAFLSNEGDIWNRDEADHIAHEFEYWMDPNCRTGEFSQATFTEMYDECLLDYICSSCCNNKQLKQLLCPSLHLAAEKEYNKISGLHLWSFCDQSDAEVRNY